MKYLATISTLLLFLMSCGETSSELADLEKQKTRNELCGVELYKKREARQCGNIYKSRKSKYCGAYQYNKLKSSKCKGYISAHTYKPNHGHSTCKKGYSKVWRERKYRVQDYERGGYRERTERYRVCIRKEHKNSCRKKAFGVESYKECRHAKHGLQEYKACRKPGFGVEKYNQCEFYKTPDQAMAYAELLEADIPMMRDHMLTHKGNFYALQNSELAMSCHIKENEGSILAQDIIASLKTKYAATFGRPYDPKNFDCQNYSDPIETAECAEGDTSAMCRSLFGYQTTVKWFAETKSDMQLIIDDLNKFGRQKIVEALMTVSQFLNNPFSEEAADAGATQE